MHGVYVYTLVLKGGYVSCILRFMNLFEHSYYISYIFMLQLHSYLTTQVLTFLKNLLKGI